MRRIASWLVAILTLFLIASLAWISFVGSPRLRERLASELSRATGYPIKMSGDLDLEFFPRPGVKVQGVEIASPNPGAGKPLVRVARLEIGIAVLKPFDPPSDFSNARASGCRGLAFAGCPGSGKLARGIHGEGFAAGRIPRGSDRSDAP